jgi:DNA mismatch repair protein MutL
MDIIQLLPDSIANQIAAGEVVQRPASAVKELMENAIDAEATHIRLIIKDAGKQLIQVLDNGKGMSETDARMSLERHATSKIRKAEDLFSLRTMGFRGEALASIAAVAQLEMRTRLATEELGTWLTVEASEVKKQETIACEKGTSISVKNLFFNIPARRNFLKSNSVEIRNIVDEFYRLALANPTLAFTYVNGDEVEFDLTAGKLNQRIVALFGKNYQQHMVPCEAETDYVKVAGYVGKPEAAKKTRGEQFLFVNDRFIRSNYLHHAVMKAYEGLLPEGSFPFYVLFLQIDPKHIDVNVHPTKTEIKFDDERSVYGVLQAGVRQAIGIYSLQPSLDFQNDTNIIEKLNAQANPRDVYYEERFQSLHQKSNLSNWERLVEGEWLSKDPALKPTQVEQLSFSQSEASSILLNNSTQEVPSSDETILFQWQGKFVVRSVKPGLMFIDQQAAHERILFEKFMSQLRTKSGESQQSLFPQSVTLGAADFALLMEMEQEVTALGFRFEVFGKNTVLVNGSPAQLSSGREKQLFEGLLEQFKINQAELSVPLPENLARALAKRASIKSGQKLMTEEMRSLADSLMVCKTPNYTPDGTPTFYIFETGKIETYFKR